ncbi:MAG: Xanthomonas phage, partial [Candidatus Parcubacteria bacterium]
MKSLFLSAGFLLLTPAFALAGSQTYSTPGTYSFSVPSYGTLTVQLWGGGGGGSQCAQCNGSWVGGGGGGGGGYATRTFSTGEVSGNVTVTVGAGGASIRTATGYFYGGDDGQAGGASSFGSYAVAYGGAGGLISRGWTMSQNYAAWNKMYGDGGGGGGSTAASGHQAGTGGGNGCDSTPYGLGTGAVIAAQSGSTGGGGGGCVNLASSGFPQFVSIGGNSTWGGGGGGGSYYPQYCGWWGCGEGDGGGGLGGTSQYGGNGGAGSTYADGDGTAGSVPGGGGGGAYAGPSGAGGAGKVIITWTAGAPACTVTADTNPMNYGVPTTLRWASSNATTFYINSVGYVTPNQSGSTTVGPLAATNYDGTIESESTISDPVLVLCTSSGQLCSPKYAKTVQTSSALKINFTTGAGHCSAGYVHAYVDGAYRLKSGLLNGPNVSTGLLDLGPVSNGSHQIELQWEGVVGGCNAGYVSSWGGSLASTYSTSATCPYILSVGPRATISQSTTTSAVGEPFTVTWSSDNATSCRVYKVSPIAGTSSWSSTTDPSGSQSASPTAVGEHHWWNECTNASGLFSTSTIIYHTVQNASCTLDSLTLQSGESRTFY